MKTETTKELERAIVKATRKQGTFGVLECTIGWYGKEIVDYITYDTKGDFRCYEIKCTLSDFHSKASKTFIGNYNYFVLTPELYKQVQNEIPTHIGVYIYGDLAKKAKRIPLSCPAYLKKDLEARSMSNIIKDSMLRSLSREAQKLYDAKDKTKLQTATYDLNHCKRELQSERKRFRDLETLLCIKFGRNYLKKIESFEDKFLQYR